MFALFFSFVQRMAKRNRTVTALCCGAYFNLHSRKTKKHAEEPYY